MIVIIPCGARKQTHLCMAKDMYIGSYHKTCLRYARSIVPEGRIYILSAKYGLLTLDKIITPYNIKMGDVGCVTIEIVKKQAKELGLINDEDIIALGGKLYRDICRGVWPECKIPIIAGGMGYQMQKLKQAHGKPL